MKVRGPRVVWFVRPAVNSFREIRRPCFVPCLSPTLAQKYRPVNQKGTMTFTSVTSRLSKLGMTQQDIADSLGVSRAMVKAGRLKPTSPNYRKPLEGWKPKLVKAARARGGELMKLAEELEA